MTLGPWVIGKKKNSHVARAVGVLNKITKISQFVSLVSALGNQSGVLLAGDRHPCGTPCRDLRAPPATWTFREHCMRGCFRLRISGACAALPREEKESSKSRCFHVFFENYLILRSQKQKKKKIYTSEVLGDLPPAPNPRLPGSVSMLDRFCVHI